MNQGFIVPDLATDKVQSCDTTVVACLFASTVTRSGELVGEEQKKRGGTLKQKWSHGKGFIDILFVFLKHVLKTSM